MALYECSLIIILIIKSWTTLILSENKPALSLLPCFGCRIMFSLYLSDFNIYIQCAEDVDLRSIGEKSWWGGWHTTKTRFRQAASEAGHAVGDGEVRGEKRRAGQWHATLSALPSCLDTARSASTLPLRFRRHSPAAPGNLHQLHRLVWLAAW